MVYKKIIYTNIRPPRTQGGLFFASEETHVPRKQAPAYEANTPTPKCPKNDKYIICGLLYHLWDCMVTFLQE